MRCTPDHIAVRSSVLSHWRRRALTGLAGISLGAAQAQVAAPSGVALEVEAQKQRVGAFQLAVERQQRLERITYPLLRVAAPYCALRRRWAVGPTPHVAELYGKDVAPGAAQLGLAGVLMFDHVVDGTPAQRAGVQAGDRVLALNGEAPPTGLAAMLWFDQRVHQLSVARQPLVLKLQREGSTLEVTSRAQQVCDLIVIATPLQVLNAFADSEHRLVAHDAMMRLFSDDNQLAVLMGHEVSHAVLRHVEKGAEPPRPPSGSGSVLIDILLGGRAARRPAIDPYAQDKERDADYLGLYLAAAAGFDVSVAPEMHRRMGALVPSGIEENRTSSHPSSPDRSLRLEAALAELRDKQLKGLPLLPDMAALPTLNATEVVTWDGRHRKVQAPAEIIRKQPGLPAFTELPFVTEDGRIAYQNFLQAKKRPRAFVLAADGRYAWASGPNAVADALLTCKGSRPAACVPYVIDEQLVFDMAALEATRRPGTAVAGGGGAAAGASVSGGSGGAAGGAVAAPRRHAVAVPPASGFADGADASKVPVRDGGAARYAHYLTLPTPKAFFVINDGGWRFWWDSPQAIAKGFEWCAANAQRCALYAVDHTVVWQDDPARRITRLDQLGPADAVAGPATAPASQLTQATAPTPRPSP